MESWKELMVSKLLAETQDGCFNFELSNYKVKNISLLAVRSYFIEVEIHM